RKRTVERAAVATLIVPFTGHERGEREQSEAADEKRDRHGRRVPDTPPAQCVEGDWRHEQRVRRLRVGGRAQQAGCREIGPWREHPAPAWRRPLLRERRVL